MNFTDFTPLGIFLRGDIKQGVSSEYREQTFAFIKKILFIERGMNWSTVYRSVRQQEEILAN